jgi:N-acetylmuramoyl-L-alanine amidase
MNARAARIPWPGAMAFCLAGLMAAWLLLATSAETRAGCDPARFPLLVDAGHGPKRSGAESARGVPEHAFNTRLAARVVAALQAAGFCRAALLDPDGLDLPPAARAARANARGARLLVSIHHDSAQPQYLSAWIVEGKTRRYCDRFAGYSLFYSGKSAQAEESLRLARLIGRELRQAGLSFTRHHAEAIPGENRPLVDEAVGVSRYDGLAVLYGARMPAVLVEAGVIVNREEEAALSRPERIETTARAIAQGVVSFCRQNTP